MTKSRRERAISSLDIRDDDGWQQAENFCRVGDPQALVLLLRSRKIIPRTQREFLADLLAGAVKVDWGCKQSPRLTDAQRAHVVRALLRERHDREAILRNADAIADRLGVDAAEVRARVAEFRRSLIERLAYHFGVAPATIRKMPRTIGRG